MAGRRRQARLVSQGYIVRSSRPWRWLDLVAGSGLNFADRGSHALKGIPGDWRIFSAGD
jgi:hypothetical protein